MLKKSDIQALLDTLPDEFEAEEFQDGFAEIANEPVPTLHLEIARERARAFQPGKAGSAEDYQKKAEQWVAERSLLTSSRNKRSSR